MTNTKCINTDCDQPGNILLSGYAYCQKHAEDEIKMRINERQKEFQLDLHKLQLRLEDAKAAAGILPEVTNEL